MDLSGSAPTESHPQEEGMQRMSLSVLEVRDSLKVRPGRLLIDGQWVDSKSGQTWTHVHPSTGEEITEFAVASAADADRAVRAASRAFREGPWPRLKARERKRLLQPLVDAIYAHSDELNLLQSLDNGLPISFGRTYRVSGEFCADAFDHHFGWIDKINGQVYPQYTEAVPMQFLSVREPVGVVVAIHPWNGPLLQFPQKVGPALAAGCTVIVKPSEYASLAILRLADLINDLDLPPGVFQILTGTGESIGDTLISHPLVDKVSFTGSRGVGRRIVQQSAERFTRVTLELGGKSPAVVFPDGDSVERGATAVAAQTYFGLSGQVCSAQTRAFVHESVFDEFVARVGERARAVRFGNPFDPDTTSGPLINNKQLSNVSSMIAKGVEDGGELVFGGDRPGGELSRGNWLNPALFVNVDNSAKIAQEEIFGPVVVAIPFKTEEEVVAMANDTEYGLAAGVYTRDVARGLRMARALRAGVVGINGYSLMPNSPMGGFNTSGVGREGGWESVISYTEVKTIAIDLNE